VEEGDGPGTEFVVPSRSPSTILKSGCQASYQNHRLAHTANPTNCANKLPPGQFMRPSPDAKRERDCLPSKG
jgi:hypothetical protein